MIHGVSALRGVGVVGEAFVEVVDLEEHPLAVGIERAKVVLFVRVVGVTEIVKDADGLDDPGNRFGAKSRNARGHHRGPSGKILTQFIVQRTDRAVLLSMTDLRFFSGRRGWVPGPGPEASSLLALSRRLGFVGRRAHQRNAGAMPEELGQVRVIAVLQAEGVAFPVEHDGLPPAVIEGLLSNHEMARPDLVPGPGQATGGGKAVLVAVCSCRLGFLPKVHNEVAVQGLSDIGHEPSAVGVKPTQRQFLGVLGYVFRTGFIDLEAQQVGGLGYEVRLGIDEPGTPRFLLLIKAKDDQGRGSGVAGRRTIW